MKAAARRQEPADEPLVIADYEDEDADHRWAMRIQSFCRSASNSARGRVRAAGLAITTMSHAGKRGWASRKLARIWRLRRLRSTASAACLREIANPRRGCSRSPATTTAVSSGVVSRLPLLKTRSKSAGFSRRARRVKRKSAQPRPGAAGFRPASGGRGPWHDDGPGPCGHRRSPCGRGNRGCACGVANAAERYVSWRVIGNSKKGRGL